MSLNDQANPFKQRQSGVLKPVLDEHIILQRVIEELLKNTRVEALYLVKKLGISLDLVNITMEVARRRLEYETMCMEKHLASVKETSLRRPDENIQAKDEPV